MRQQSVPQQLELGAENPLLLTAAKVEEEF
jgi:hypothetical protein